MVYRTFVDHAVNIALSRCPVESSHVRLRVNEFVRILSQVAILTRVYASTTFIPTTQECIRAVAPTNDETISFRCTGKYANVVSALQTFQAKIKYPDGRGKGINGLCRDIICQLFLPEFGTDIISKIELSGRGLLRDQDDSAIELTLDRIRQDVSDLCRLVQSNGDDLYSLAVNALVEFADMDPDEAEQRVRDAIDSDNE